MNISKWINTNINQDNFKNKNIFITGSNSGIGYELAKHVLNLGANLFMLCRNESKAKLAINDLLKLYPNSQIHFIKLDLASFSSIEHASNEIKKYDVDMFINNAGVFRLPKGKTSDNIEIIMGTNFIGTLYLSSLLLPYFNTLPHNVYVTYETSVTSKLSKINYSDFFMDKHYSEMKIYARSKVAINNIYYHYINTYKNSNIILSLTHPGGTYTPLIAKGYRFKPFQLLAKGFMKLVFHSPDKASLTILYALNSGKNIVVGPRGLFEISGFPKEVRINMDPQVESCIDYGLKIINSTKGEN